MTTIGGEFPAWGAGGRTVHWSLGNAHFVYDLDAARAYEERMAADEDVEESAAEGDDGDESGVPGVAP